MLAFEVTNNKVSDLSTSITYADKTNCPEVVTVVTGGSAGGTYYNNTGTFTSTECINRSSFDSAVASRENIFIPENFVFKGSGTVLNGPKYLCWNEAEGKYYLSNGDGNYSFSGNSYTPSFLNNVSSQYGEQ